tara:strand:- start:1009 stop:1515 length:507 start_codon:yes stop_codon:yes gene_type:complete
MNLEYKTFVEVQAQLAAFFADPGDEEQAAIKAREDYYRNWIAERPKLPPTPEPPPVEFKFEKPKYRKPRQTFHRKATRRKIKRLSPDDIDSCADDIQDWRGDCSASNPDEIFYLGLMSALRKSVVFSGWDQQTYTVDDHIIEAAESWHDHLRVDARDMEWDGYEWTII